MSRVDEIREQLNKATYKVDVLDVAYLLAELSKRDAVLQKINMRALYPPLVLDEDGNARYIQCSNCEKQKTKVATLKAQVECYEAELKIVEHCTWGEGAANLRIKAVLAKGKAMMDAHKGRDE